MMTRRLAAGTLALAILIPASGCGSDAGAPAVSGSMEEATVKGVVRLRGKPMKNGRVTFRTANVNRPNAPVREAEIGAGGEYTARTLVGLNFVEIAGAELTTPRNRMFLDNEQSLIIKSGENTLDLDLPPKAPAGP